MVAVAVSDIDRSQVLAARRDPFHCGVRLLDGKKGVDENSVSIAINKCGRCRHPHPFFFPRWQIAGEALAICYSNFPLQHGASGDWHCGPPLHPVLISQQSKLPRLKWPLIAHTRRWRTQMKIVESERPAGLLIVVMAFVYHPRISPMSKSAPGNLARPA